MYAAWRSSRVRMWRIEPGVEPALASASYKGRLVSPQSPKITSTPCALSISTTASAPLSATAGASTGLFMQLSYAAGAAADFTTIERQYLWSRWQYHCLVSRSMLAQMPPSPYAMPSAQEKCRKGPSTSEDSP